MSTVAKTVAGTLYDPEAAPLARGMVSTSVPSRSRIHQLSALAGTWLPSWSVAFPLYWMALPPWNVAPEAGVRIVAARDGVPP